VLKNFLITSYRNLIHNKLYSIINIAGLSIGIAFAFLVALQVIDEFSYDRFYKDADRIYRVALKRIYPQNEIDYAIIPVSIGEAAKNDFPEIESYTRLLVTRGEFIIRNEKQAFKERNVCFADSNFFEMFNIPFISGNPKNALRDPGSFVITKSTARKYFGNEDALGKTLITPNGVIKISGVCADIPKNSHLQFDFLGSLKITGLLDEPNYYSFSVLTYIKLKPGADPAALEKKFPRLVEKYAAGQIEKATGISFKDYTKAGNGYEYFLQPLKKIHLYSDLEGEIKPNGNILYVIIYLSIALFVLVVASINFVNLTTARSTERAKEVGIRKLSGSTRIQLIGQFFSESLSITAVSLILAVAIAGMVLPFFNSLLGKQLEILYFDNWYTIPVLLLLGIIVGLLAGIYPAFVLSSVKPISVLKGNYFNFSKGSRQRNILVVFQFFISIALISVFILIYNQINYLNRKNLGYDKNNVLIIERAHYLENAEETFEERIQKLPGVVNTARSNTEITGGYYFGVMFQKELKNSDVITSRAMVVDNNFIPTLGLKVLQGRGFSNEFNDSLSIIINESAVREFHLTNPVGTRLYVTAQNEQAPRQYTIVGVVKDFHYNSLHQDIKSFVLMNVAGPFQVTPYINVRLSGKNTRSTILQIEKIWHEFLPDQPFGYFFLSDKINNLYKDDRNSGKIFGILTALAIFIACIGLFGLSAYSTQRQTKAIGVRKVMGATTWQICFLLSKNMISLIGIAFLLALPLSWFVMQKWLDNFVYRIHIQFWIFFVSGIIAILVAIITISYHVIKASFSNPVESLKYE
jgi:putative ABC transport system permease protein